jgi:hypothetical protein
MCRKFFRQKKDDCSEGKRPVLEVSNEVAEYRRDMESYFRSFVVPTSVGVFPAPSEA